MAVTGHLRTMTAGDLFQWISLAQKTGTLSVSAHGIEKLIYFRDGRVIASASTDPREYLGQFLMSHGYVSEEELKKAVEVQNQSKILLGKILVMINVISERDLLRLMRLKAEEGIYDVFLWSDGEFRFTDDDLPKNAMVPLNIEITGIVMEGLRRLDEWGRIRQVIPHSNVVPGLRREVDGSALREPQQTIVRCVNGQRPIEEIILESRSSEFIVSKTIFDYVSDGVMEIVETRAAPETYVEEPLEPPDDALPESEVTPEAAQPEAVVVPMTAASEADEVTTLLNRAQAVFRSGDFEKALRTLKAAQSLDPLNAKVKNALKSLETVVAAELRKSGITDSRIPRLARSFDQLSGMDFSPSEGFVLSRINGQWDLGSIIKISPIGETDALLIFHRLSRDGVIEFVN
jgi:hypothetical protein